MTNGAFQQSSCRSNHSGQAQFRTVNLINQLDEEDRNLVFKIIDTMFSIKKFNDFFNNKIAAL